MRVGIKTIAVTRRPTRGDLRLIALLSRYLRALILVLDLPHTLSDDFSNVSTRFSAVVFHEICLELVFERTRTRQFGFAEDFARQQSGDDFVVSIFTHHS